MSPIVENPTAAELNRFQCEGCGKKFKDFILFKCVDCLKKGWYEITLNPKWFPGKLEDGTPDWNSVKKDKPQFGTDWSYGRLNIETMEYERVTIDKKGPKWDYLTSLKEKEAERNAMKDADAYSNLLREINNNKQKTAKQVKAETKLHEKMDKEFIKVEKREQKEATEEVNPTTGDTKEKQ